MVYLLLIQCSIDDLIESMKLECIDFIPVNYS
jgi:hypothetical protein